ncbi:MAG TPA: hypothetical protein VFD82_03050 [Planctomycetota bacterium]|nr:hypothetical protein [Planctomycetota bacterium]
MPVSAGTSSIVLKKDMLLVPESDRWTAFSAYRGTFVPLFVPFASSTIVHEDSVACVRNGSTLHTFSAFTGQWHTRQLPGGWLLQLGSRMALIHTPFVGSNLAASAFDVYSGQWFDAPSQPLLTYGAQATGGTAVVSTQAMQLGFSALRPGWVQAPVTATFPFPFINGLSFEREFARGVDAVFSGIAGTFASAPLPAATVEMHSNVATTVDVANRFVCGAGQNVWTAMPGPYLTPGSDIPMTWGNGQVHAFSPLLGTVAATPWNQGFPSLFASGRTVAMVFDALSGAHPVFSSFTGQWHTPPANTLAEAPYLAANCALLRTTNGVTAFAPRSASFAPLPGATTRYNGYAASSATTMNVFDAHGERWLSLPLQASTTLPTFGMRTMLIGDGTNMLGFAMRSRQFAAVPLPEVVAEVRASDDVGFVRTATHVLAFSGLGETVTWQDAPDGIYGVGLGATATIQARVPANHFVAMAFGPPAAAPLPVPLPTPFGELWLDPGSAVVFAVAAAVGESRAVVPIAVPNVLALRGSTWLQQTVTLAPSGGIWLGAPSTLLVQ